MGRVKNQIMSLCKTNPTLDYSKQKRTKNFCGRGNKASKLKIKNNLKKDNTIKNIGNLFILK